MSNHISNGFFQEAFTAYTNILEMLEDRGCQRKYLEKYYKLDFPQFMEMEKKGELDIRVISDVNNCIYIVKFLDYKLNKNNFTILNSEIRDIINEEEDICYRVIAVTSEDLPPVTKTIMANINKARRQLPDEDENEYLSNSENFDEKDKLLEYEHFNFDKLRFNPTKSQYVPKHIILSDKEGQDVLNSFNLTKAQLPGIIVDDGQFSNKDRQPDRIAKWIGLKVGQIIRVEGKVQSPGNILIIELVLYKYSLKK